MEVKSKWLSTPLTSALLSFFLLLTTLAGFGQKTNLIGLNLNGEVYPDGFRPSIGATFETQLGKHSGGETGIYYRTEITQGYVTYTDSSGSRSYNFTVAERYFNMPILYKFYSRIVNFSAGPTLDLFAGWQQKREPQSINVESYDVDPKFRIGFLVKVSKAILLSNRIILEPELRYGSLEGLEGGGLEVGVGLKYNFFDLH